MNGIFKCEVVIGFLCIILASCENVIYQIEESDLRDTIIINKVDKYREEIPITEDDEGNFEKNLGNIMGIPDVSKTTADFYLRIWFWDDDVKYVVDIERNKAKYNCVLRGFNSKKTDSGEIIITHYRINNIGSKAAWDTIFQNWPQIKLAATIKGKKARDYSTHLTLLSEVNFEIKEGGTFLYSECLEPSFYRTIDPRAQLFYDFLKILNKQLNLQVYMPSEKLVADPPNK